MRQVETGTVILSGVVRHASCRFSFSHPPSLPFSVPFWLLLPSLTAFVPLNHYTLCLIYHFYLSVFLPAHMHSHPWQCGVHMPGGTDTSFCMAFPLPLLPFLPLCLPSCLACLPMPSPSPLEVVEEVEEGGGRNL